MRIAIAEENSHPKKVGVEVIPLNDRYTCAHHLRAPSLPQTRGFVLNLVTASPRPQLLRAAQARTQLQSRARQAPNLQNHGRSCAA